jgi:uncharacterized protein YndB with AHSA1/START domain
VPSLATTSTTKPNEISVTRIYDAPVQAVWDAWADPVQAAQWWGPRGFTITTHSKDLRVGGEWNYTMHGPDGTDYPNTTSYLEVEPLAKLVYDHGANATQPPIFRVTVLFTEVEGKTHLAMTMALPDAEAAQNTRKFIKQAGGNGTWDRLAEYLGKQLSDQEQFVINRSFEAPLGVVFDMWSQPEQVARWIAPTGFEMRYVRADLRTGGTSLCCMSGMGVSLYSRIEYEQVSAPELIVYRQQFCDEHENIIRNLMAPTWPDTTRTTVVFAAEGPGTTRVTVTSVVVGTVTPEEMATFTSARTSMTQGWTGSFDKLDALLPHAEG